MSRTPARFRQCDIARAIKAVEQCGVDMRVRLALSGDIVIERDRHDDDKPEAPLEASREFRL
jgi:hypothetical protein